MFHRFDNFSYIQRYLRKAFSKYWLITKKLLNHPSSKLSIEIFQVQKYNRNCLTYIFHVLNRSVLQLEKKIIECHRKEKLEFEGNFL